MGENELQYHGETRDNAVFENATVVGDEKNQQHDVEAIQPQTLVSSKRQSISDLFTIVSILSRIRFVIIFTRHYAY